MNFEDEPYIRVYKRRTLTIKLLGWEGRAVFRELLLEVDRAGVLDLGDEDPAQAVAALTDIPLEIVELGLGRAVKLGAVTIRDKALFVPRFMEAQEAKQSDKARQRESRSKRAALMRVSEHAVRGIPPETVTNRDHMGSQNVTNGHTPSHAVTAGHTVSPNAQLSSAQLSSNPPSGDTPIAPKGGKRGAARPWRRFPPEFQPSEEHQKLAAELRVDLELELAKIRDFEFARPRSDPDATLRTWIRTAAERQSRVRTVGSGNIAADNIKRQLERVKMLEEKERREAAGEAV